MRVYCRVKPLDCVNNEMGPEDSTYTLALRKSTMADQNSCISIPDTTGDILNRLELITEKEPLSYHFDGVFSPGTT